MGGWDAGTSVLTSVTVGMIEGNVIGNAGGAQAVTLTTAQMPAHTHFVAREGTEGGDSGFSGVPAAASIFTGSTGGGGAHSNIPPALIVNFVIKT